MLLWYARFEMFRALGPSRNVAQAYHAHRQELGRKPHSVEVRWNLKAIEWRWRERAVADDRADAYALAVAGVAWRGRVEASAVAPAVDPVTVIDARGGW